DRLNAGSRGVRPRRHSRRRARAGDRHRRLRRMTAPYREAPSAAPVTDTSPRRGRLALSLQEALTTGARLRANKQVATDAESFRARIKQVLSTAEQDARAQGYAGEDARYALFAVIALLDETVLNSGQPMFAAWSSRTLQEEVFGVHMAG